MSWNRIERRRFIRVPEPVPVFLSFQGKILNSKVVNIGAGGIGLLLETELPSASVVDLEIKLKEKTLNCTGRIVWSIKEKDQGQAVLLFDTGIEFFKVDEVSRKVIMNFVKALL